MKTKLNPVVKRLVLSAQPASCQEGLATALVLASFAISPQHASALGVRIPNLDAAAIARGNAFVATADNPSAVYYNPAGITQLEGHNFQIGSLFYAPIFADYKSQSGQKIENDHDILAVPNAYYTFSPKDSRFSFGLGVYAPFGLTMKWPESAPFAPFGLEGRLQYITASPVVAWQPHPTISIAAGPTFNYSNIRLGQSVQGVPNSKFSFKGNDLDIGYTAGVMWQPHPKWSVGASYFSQTTQDYEGDSGFRPSPPLPAGSETSAKFKFPQFIRGGVSYRPTAKWNFEVDIDWTDWDRVNDLPIKGVGTIPLQWNSSFFYHGGVTRYLDNGWFVSAGYFFSESSTSEKYFTPIVPDTDLHVGSVGIGRKGKRWDWAVAGQLIAGPYRDVDDALAPPVRGQYKLLAPTFSFSVGYHF